MGKEEVKTVTLRSGRVSKAPARFDTSDPSYKAKSKPVDKTKAGKASTAKPKKATPAKASKKATTKAAAATKKAPAKKSVAKKAAKKAAKKDEEPKRLYEPKKPGSKEAVLPDVSSKLKKDQREALEGMSVADLKRVLKANDCICTGTKSELHNRVAWYVLHGVPERCPSCYTGRLKLDIYGNYFCPGAFDDDVLVPCSYTCSSPKTKDWVAEENSAI